MLVSLVKIFWYNDRNNQKNASTEKMISVYIRDIGSIQQLNEL